MAGGLSKDSLTDGMKIVLAILILMVSVGAIGVLGPLVVGAIQNFALDGSINITDTATQAVNNTGNQMVALFAKTVAPILLIIGLVGLVVLLKVFGLDKIFKDMFKGSKKGKGGFRME